MTNTIKIETILSRYDIDRKTFYYRKDVLNIKSYSYGVYEKKDVEKIIYYKKRRKKELCPLKIIERYIKAKGKHKTTEGILKHFKRKNKHSAKIDKIISDYHLFRTVTVESKINYL